MADTTLHTAAAQHDTKSLSDLFAATYERLATWGDRNLDPGKDGAALPDHLRRVIDDTTHYI